MSEQKRNVRDEPWAKHAPEYMIEAIALLVEGREEGRAMLAMLNAREAVVVSQEQVIHDRETALVRAVEDMKAFANQLYGPGSELAKINLRLDDLPHGGEINRRLDGHEVAITDLTSRVVELEKNQRKTA